MNQIHDRAIVAAQRVGLVDIPEMLDEYSQRAASESWTYLKFACELVEEQARRAEVRS